MMWSRFLQGTELRPPKVEGRSTAQDRVAEVEQPFVEMDVGS